MQHSISKRVYKRINQFYENAAKRHLSSDEEILNNINNVISEVNKIGVSLIPTNTTLSNWEGYDVCRSKPTNWYFAYKIEDNVVYVYDAEHGQNMTDQAYTSHPHKKQIQYKPVPKHQYCYGLLMVKANNDEKYNFVNQNNEIFYPLQWFNQAEDFKKWENGVVAARVSNSYEWYFLVLDGKEGKLYKGGDGNYKTENYQPDVLQQILIEQQLKTSLDFMRRLLVV